MSGASIPATEQSPIVHILDFADASPVDARIAEYTRPIILAVGNKKLMRPLVKPVILFSRAPPENCASANSGYKTARTPTPANRTNNKLLLFNCFDPAQEFGKKARYPCKSPSDHPYARNQCRPRCGEPAPRLCEQRIRHDRIPIQC